MSPGQWQGIATPALRYAGRPGFSAMPIAGLLVGEYPAPGDAPWLRGEHRVDAVVCLQDEFDLAAKRIDAGALGAAYGAQGIEFVHHPVADADPLGLAAQLGGILADVRRCLGAGRRVYLHCNAGFNRAPTVAIAYLRVHGGMTLAEAWRAVRDRRPCAPYRRALAAAFPGEALP